MKYVCHMVLLLSHKGGGGHQTSSDMTPTVTKTHKLNNLQDMGLLYSIASASG